MTRCRFPFVLTLSLSTLALGAAGCSNSHSPTEPALSNLDSPAKSSISSVSDQSRGSGSGGSTTSGRRGRGRGGDDQANDNQRRGRGNGNNNRPDDRQQPPRAGQEFEGTVVAVNGQTLTLAGGTRVLVNGQTQFIARGDLFSLSQISTSVAAGRPTRVEGRGVRQADGSILAQTIKAEVDDEEDDD